VFLFSNLVLLIFSRTPECVRKIVGHQTIFLVFFCRYPTCDLTGLSRFSKPESSFMHRRLHSASSPSMLLLKIQPIIVILDIRADPACSLFPDTLRPHAHSASSRKTSAHSYPFMPQQSPSHPSYHIPCLTVHFLHYRMDVMYHRSFLPATLA
jgi:hypothetical protein